MEVVTYIGDEDYLDESSSGLGAIIKVRPEITFNNTRTYANGKKAPDGIEIRFGSNKPVLEVREMLIDHRFRFSEKQTLWYAIDNARSRELAERLATMEVDVDDARYEKLSFWKRLQNIHEFEALREKTEFAVNTTPIQYFYSKSAIRSRYPALTTLLRHPGLSYKRYYNRPIETGSGTEPEPAASNQTENKEIAQKLKALADAMQKVIDSKIDSATSRQRPTAKRLRVAQSMAQEGYRLKGIQTSLYALADAHEGGDISMYPRLSKLRTRADVELIEQYDVNRQRYAQFGDQLKKLRINNEDEWRYAYEEKQKLVSVSKHAKAKSNDIVEQQIKELELKAFKASIPGFFPTPKGLIADLLELAELQEGQMILEPSAGKGDILDAIAKESLDDVTLHAVEVNSTLREILALKGYVITAENFLKYTPGRLYDRIVMNPPFEDGQDIDHVLHAFSLLKPGGRLAAIVSEGPFFRKFKKDNAFRAFLNSENAYVSEPVDQGFKNAFNSTSVRVRLIALNASKVGGSNPVAQQDILEIEAEAELELLKMRVEAKRKNQAGNLGGVLDLHKLKDLRRQAWILQYKTDALKFN